MNPCNFMENKYKIRVVELSLELRVATIVTILHDDVISLLMQKMYNIGIKVQSYITHSYLVLKSSVVIKLVMLREPRRAGTSGY